MALPDVYEELAALTHRMVDAARVQDWDELTTVGNQRDRLYATIPAKLPPMSTRDGARIAKLIEEILACHSEITDRAAPWLDQTRQMLAAFERASNAESMPTPQANTP